MACSRSCSCSAQRTGTKFRLNVLFWGCPSPSARSPEGPSPKGALGLTPNSKTSVILTGSFQLKQQQHKSLRFCRWGLWGTVRKRRGHVSPWFWYYYQASKLQLWAGLRREVLVFTCLWGDVSLPFTHGIYPLTFILRRCHNVSVT